MHTTRPITLVRWFKALELGASELIVVDDGSSDHTAALAQQSGATVLRNRRNLGKGVH